MDVSEKVAKMVNRLDTLMKFGMELPHGETVTIQEFHDHTVVRNALAVAYQQVMDVDQAWTKAFKKSCELPEFAEAVRKLGAD